MGASGLQRRQGARSLRDRQLPTALPALDRTSTRRHGADNRPKGGSALRPAGNHFAAGRFPVPIPVGGTVLDSSFRNGTPFSLEVRRKHSPGGPFSIKMAKLVPPTKVCPFTSALIGGALWCLFRRNVPPERWNCFQKDKLVKGNEKSSAGGRVNAAGSEFGLTVPGLSNRSLYPPASKVCAGA